MVSTSDAELRVAVARVLSRYAAVLGDGDGGEADGEDARVLRRAARRTAAFEMEYAGGRHREAVAATRRAAVAALRELLAASLRRAGGRGEELEAARLAVRAIGG